MKQKLKEEMLTRVGKKKLRAEKLSLEKFACGTFEKKISIKNCCTNRNTQ
ncbi:MAG: hypothetical protein IPN76_26855 [Saprospiraceae bacterium]|nr:hypothetical protein [Saprospiraceae bacterium]